MFFGENYSTHRLTDCYRIFSITHKLRLLPYLAGYPKKYGIVLPSLVVFSTIMINILTEIQCLVFLDLKQGAVLAIFKYSF